MALFDTLQNDLNAARKAQDKARTLVLGTIFSDAKNRKIELRRDLTDEEVVEVLRKGIKRRRESKTSCPMGCGSIVMMTGTSHSVARRPIPDAASCTSREIAAARPLCRP